ncbi:hypothetical protein BZK37_11475 [Enterococcus casseliflavus]|nr:hypothetical protein BZK37_11475 [Enterococcus casseliflavus]
MKKQVLLPLLLLLCLISGCGTINSASPEELSERIGAALDAGWEHTYHAETLTYELSIENLELMIRGKEAELAFLDQVNSNSKHKAAFIENTETMIALAQEAIEARYLDMPRWVAARNGRIEALLALHEESPIIVSRRAKLQELFNEYEEDLALVTVGANNPLADEEAINEDSREKLGLTRDTLEHLHQQSEDQEIEWQTAIDLANGVTMNVFSTKHEPVEILTFTNAGETYPSAITLFNGQTTEIVPEIRTPYEAVSAYFNEIAAAVYETIPSGYLFLVESLWLELENDNRFHFRTYVFDNEVTEETILAGFHRAPTVAARYERENNATEREREAFFLVRAQGNRRFYSKQEMAELLETEGFTAEETQWALETLDVDWYRHALGRANQSRRVLGIRQRNMAAHLEGNGFLPDEIEFAIKNMDN